MVFAKIQINQKCYSVQHCVLKIQSPSSKIWSENDMHSETKYNLLVTPILH